MPYRPQPSNIISGYQEGRRFADDEQARGYENQLRGLDVKAGQEFQNLAHNPNATPDQYAKLGRSDVSNALVNNERQGEARKQATAQKLLFAAQYAGQSPNPKAFIEQNFPELVQHAGPAWATATDDQVRQELAGITAKMGAQAGVGPTPEPVKFETRQGPRGSVIQVDPRTNEQRQVVGPDNSQSGGGSAPAGYRYRADGALEPIPGGPADPNTSSTRNNDRLFAKADKLRDEFNAASKDFIAVGDSFNTVRAAAKDPTAAGDLSMIFAYMKMLDPNSVVREQEFANAQNAAGVPDQVQNAWNRALRGERLNPTQRADFIAQAEKVYQVSKKRNEGVVKRYTDIAVRNKVDPQDVIGDLGVFEETAGNTAPAAPVQVKSDQEYAALKPGTSYMAPDGTVRTKR